ncbi:hypothetical protein DFR52_101398 [Hoeflea marina]|uniref:Uncharacterized protein n=1 Tax=Hoeflea marina TaxID=274592 RepID=A0A317PQH6_9HYPH|nr:hypothetical protein [Hoeflea marina]PWW03712.1 hypothetical protein DFR52_101398 [Hoeflea marina]
MAKIVPIRTYRQAAPALPFVVEQDDFSIKVSLPDDPIFWVRLEMAAAGPVVSDFNPGSQQEESLARALSRALDKAAVKRLSGLPFLDMVRGGLQPNNGPALIEARNRVQRAAEFLAGERRQTIEGVSMRERRGKMDFIVSFGGGN